MVELPLELLNKLMPALLGAGITYRKLLGQPGYEYLTEEIVREYEHDLETLLAIMIQAGWTPPDEDKE